MHRKNFVLPYTIFIEQTNFINVDNYYAFLDSSPCLKRRDRIIPGRKAGIPDSFRARATQLVPIREMSFKNFIISKRTSLKRNRFRKTSN
jgi:hypothetical protein